MYNHSLPKILSVLSITRRKPGLPVVSLTTVDDMKWNLMGVDNALRKILLICLRQRKRKLMAQPEDVGKDQLAVSSL